MRGKKKKRATAIKYKKCGEKKDNGREREDESEIPRLKENIYPTTDN